MGLLLSFGVLGHIGASGCMAPRSRVDDLGSRWFSFFMYYASGPPPARLRQLLALADAGVVRFVGAGTTVRLDDDLGRFVARSTSHDDVVVADATSTPASPRRRSAAHPIACSAPCYGRGDVVEEVLTDGDWTANTGKLLTDPELRVVTAAGLAAPASLRGRHVHEPPGGRRLRPPTHERPVVPPARRPRPHGPRRPRRLSRPVLHFRPDRAGTEGQDGLRQPPRTVAMAAAKRARRRPWWWAAASAVSSGAAPLPDTQLAPYGLPRAFAASPV